MEINWPALMAMVGMVIMGALTALCIEAKGPIENKEEVIIGLSVIGGAMGGGGVTYGVMKSREKDSPP